MNSIVKYLAFTTIVLVGFTSCKKTELEDLMIQKESAAVDHDNKLDGSYDDLLFDQAEAGESFTSGKSGSFGTDGGDDEGGTDPNLGGNSGGNGGGNSGGIIGGDENEDDDDDEGGIIGGDENEEDDDKEGKGKGNGILKGGSATGGLGSGGNTGSGNSGSTGGGN